MQAYDLIFTVAIKRVIILKAFTIIIKCTLFILIFQEILSVNPYRIWSDYLSFMQYEHRIMLHVTNVDKLLISFKDLHS